MNLSFPDGLDGEAITIELCNSNQVTNDYTVPVGKSLYVLSIQSGGSLNITDDNGNLCQIASNGVQNTNQASGRKSINNPLILKEGQTISGYNNSGYSTSFNGILVNTNVQIITIGTQDTYTVPANKKLIITNSGGYIHKWYSN